jgi:hypothetical protein
MLNWFEKQIYLKKNYAPGPLLDLFSPLAFKVILTADKMKVFEILDRLGPLSLNSISSEIKGDSNCIKILLDTLVNLGYLKEKKGVYKNSKMTEKWMLDSSDVNLSEMMDFFDDAFDRWQNLDQSIITGKPSITGKDWFNKNSKRWDSYHANLRIAAKLLAGEIVKKTDLPLSSKKLVDIGGSHGFYCIEFCKKYPQLNAVIFDWKEAKTTAVDTINKFDMNGRISFKEGDVMTGSPGNDYDVVLLFNTIRAFSEEEALIVLTRINSFLKKGGIILVADQFCTSLKSGFSRTNALLIVLELINGSRGKPHTSKDVTGMLLKTGFSNTKETLLSRSPGISILTAYKS